MTVGGRSKLAVCIAIAIALGGLASPAAADEGTRECKVLVGTHVPANGENLNVSATATSSTGGAGECELATLQAASTVDDVTVPEGCQVFADVDDDAFVEEAVVAGATYGPETSLHAFCEAGTTMADNAITLSAA